MRNPAIVLYELLIKEGCVVDIHDAMKTVDYCAALMPRDTSWPPSSAEINNLPNNLRRFVMELETRCDHAGDVRRIGMLEIENTQLRALIAELQEIPTNIRRLD